MTEVTITEAAQIVRRDGTPVHRVTVFRWVEDGLLPVRRVGLRRDIRIDLDMLHAFADRNGYDYDAALAAELGK